MKKALTTGDIADYCQVTHRTVLDWVIQGKIKAYQTPGRHTRVLIHDFIDFCREYNIPVDEELTGGSDNGKDRVLIVDDDKQMVSALKRYLCLQDNIEVDTAYGGFSAGTKFVQFKPHVVILDIRMPGISGIDVCESIRSCPEHKNVKILAITADADTNLPTKMKQIGADAFLLKPFSNEDLLAKIREIRAPRQQAKQLK
ncbi:MAG: response regulator [Candidatus Omnitrophica bacterium]|nr:response regulator [Candidatus Omnitrophota bacterium]